MRAAPGHAPRRAPGQPAAKTAGILALPAVRELEYILRKRRAKRRMGKDSMRSVERALNVLEYITEHAPIGLSELSRSLNIPKATVQRAIETLARSGWIEATDSELRRWTISTKQVLRIQRAAGHRGSLRSEALREMEALRSATGETIVLAVRDGDEVVNIEQIESQHAVRISIPVGSHGPIHRTCAGVAVASLWLPAEIDHYAEANLGSEPALEDHFRAQVASARARGFAVCTFRLREGLIAISAPIIDAAGRPLAALTLSAPAARMSLAELEARGPLLIDAVSRISGR